jgi:hypothetical protein
MMTQYQQLLINKGIKELTYHRKPTEWEIKLGYGALHFKEFELNKCINKYGYIKRSLKCKEDGLVYRY